MASQLAPKNTRKVIVMVKKKPTITPMKRNVLILWKKAVA